MNNVEGENMPIAQSVKDEVFMTATIELERLFGVLRNHYGRPEFREHARLLPIIESACKATLDKLKTSKLPK